MSPKTLTLLTLLILIFTLLPVSLEQTSRSKATSKVSPKKSSKPQKPAPKPAPKPRRRRAPRPGPKTPAKPVPKPPPGRLPAPAPKPALPVVPVRSAMPAPIITPNTNPPSPLPPIAPLPSILAPSPPPPSPPTPTPVAGPTIPTGDSISIGYGSGYTFNIPVGANDSLSYFVDAMTALASKGGTLTIGPGTFVFSFNWKITASNALIQGAGMGQTILKLMDNAARFKYAGFIYALSSQNVTVMDLTIDGNKANQSPAAIYGRFCVLMADYRNWKFQRVECMNNQEYGFDPHGIKEETDGVHNVSDPRNVWSYDLTIEDCISHDNGWDGFTVDMTIGVVVRNCTSYKNGRHGFNIVTASSNVVVENNRAYDNGFAPPGSFACGLLADTNKAGFVTNNVVFRNNVVERQSGTGGACVKGARDILFVGNQISDSSTCGTFSRPETGVVFSNNVCSRNQQQIKLKDGGAMVTLDGNIFN